MDSFSSGVDTKDENFYRTIFFLIPFFDLIHIFIVANIIIFESDKNDDSYGILNRFSNEKKILIVQNHGAHGPRGISRICVETSRRLLKK